MKLAKRSKTEIPKGIKPKKKRRSNNTSAYQKQIKLMIKEDAEKIKATIEAAGGTVKIA